MSSFIPWQWLYGCWLYDNLLSCEFIFWHYLYVYHIIFLRYISSMGEVATGSKHRPHSPSYAPRTGPDAGWPAQLWAVAASLLSVPECNKLSIAGPGMLRKPPNLFLIQKVGKDLANVRRCIYEEIKEHRNNLAALSSRFCSFSHTNRENQTRPR